MDLSAYRTFDKRLKETKDLFEKWKIYTDSGNNNIPVEELRQHTRSMVILSLKFDYYIVDLLSHLDEMENLISELTRCMTIIEKNRDSNRFRYIDNVLLFIHNI